MDFDFKFKIVSSFRASRKSCFPLILFLYSFATDLVVLPDFSWYFSISITQLCLFLLSFRWALSVLPQRKNHEGKNKWISPSFCLSTSNLIPFRTSPFRLTTQGELPRHRLRSRSNSLVPVQCSRWMHIPMVIITHVGLIMCEKSSPNLSCSEFWVMTDIICPGNLGCDPDSFCRGRMFPVLNTTQRQAYMFYRLDSFVQGFPETLLTNILLRICAWSFYLTLILGEACLLLLCCSTGSGSSSMVLTSPRGILTFKFVILCRLPREMPLCIHLVSGDLRAKLERGQSSEHADGLKTLFPVMWLTNSQD